MVEVLRVGVAAAAAVMVGAVVVVLRSLLSRYGRRPNWLSGPGGLKKLMIGQILGRLVERIKHLAGAAHDGAADIELVLLLLAAELEVGATFQQALGRVAAHAPPSLAPELEQLAKRVVGGDWIQALRDWAAVRRDPLLDDLVATVEIQQGTGGSLAPILRGLAAMNRSRRLLQAQSRSKSAEARMSAWVLAVAPVGIALYAGSARPGFLDPLWTEPLGRLALVYGLVSWTVGVFWIGTLLRGIPGKGS